MHITIYTTAKCHHCHELKAYLNENGLPFVERDINSDVGARMELIKRNILAVPTLFINDDIIVGFNLQKIEEILRK